ncbi:rhodopsin [Anopheles darlingi]|uniref:Rhodopsin n=1 Tax=Anopheles darlingi TaxID=43151 RepID=W5J3M6_ANODA|nr:rhodopsin [Anopheles darlingi]
MAAFVEPHFDAWTQGASNMSVVDKVPPEMLHMVHPHWNQFPPMNPLWHSILGFAIFVLGMVSMIGNGCVIYIFTNTKSLRTPSNLLVVNLAFSDFFMMFTMGPPMAVSAHEKNMREQAKKMNVASLRSQEAQNTSTEMKLAKVALVTISLWFMAWTPYLVINFTGIFKAAPISPLATIWGSLFAKANAVYNPIVYGISHPKYRAALYQKFPSLSCQDSPADDGHAQEAVRLATLRLPKGSYSEKKFAEMIDKIHQSVKVLQKNVDQVKQKISTQQVQLESRKKNVKEKSFTLPAKQEEIIKQIIGEMYTQINGNVNDVKKINNILNIT